nr:hypothetical protein HK105_006709 [Polyrhizophydium stewartii]
MILLTASGVMAALALVAAAATGAGGGPAIRADNKSDAVLAVAVLSDGYPYRPDQQFFGMRMAALEINNLSTLLPGATLNVQRVTLPPMSQLAAIYDKAVDICDSRNFSFLAGNLRSSTTYATTIVCPNIPFVSTLSSAPVLSDKTRASISHFKYFGWSKVGLVVSNTGILPDLRAMYFSMFSESGINILANVLIPAYNPAISRLYYPQIRQPFEFLKASRLRIFVACIDAAQMIDIMLAANQTGLVGRDYGMYTDINMSQTDASQQDYPGSLFLDDPGTDNQPSLFVTSAYDAVWATAYAFDELWLAPFGTMLLIITILVKVDGPTPFMFVTWKAPSKSQLVYIDDSDTYKWVCKSPPESHPWIDIGFALMLIVAICAGVLVAMNGNLPKQLNDSLNAHITLLVVTLNIGLNNGPHDQDIHFAMVKNIKSIRPHSIANNRYATCEMSFETGAMLVQFPNLAKPLDRGRIITEALVAK